MRIQHEFLPEFLQANGAFKLRLFLTLVRYVAIQVVPVLESSAALGAVEPPGLEIIGITP